MGGTSPHLGPDQVAEFFGMLDNFNLDLGHSLSQIPGSLYCGSGDLQCPHKGPLPERQAASKQKTGIHSITDAITFLPKRDPVHRFPEILLPRLDHTGRA